MKGRWRPSADGPLRVLMVAPTSFFADYGCHVRILEEIRALHARGHSVRLCTYHNGNDVPGIALSRSIGVPWLRRTEVGSSRHKVYLDIALTAETLRRARTFRPDIIHGHLHEGALIGATIGRIMQCPVVFDYQGSLTEEMLDHRFIRSGGLRERAVRKLERYIDRLPQAIIPSGEPAASYLHQRGIRSDRITTLVDGVDLQRMDPVRAAPLRPSTRERLGIPCDAPVAVYLGLLADYQGIPLLIEAARLLLQRRPDAYVVIAGYPGADIYKREVRSLGIDQHVLFPGRIPYDDAAAILAAGDVAVAPKVSSTESNGKVLNYMAMGLPTVALDTAINRSILGGLGRLVPVDDAPGFARQIEAAFDDGPEVGAALRDRVRTHFSWDARVLELEAVYRRVLADRRAGITEPLSVPAPVSGASES